jgi:Amt family ammonium transporter
VLYTLIKNIMIIPLVTVTFFFGWWIYWAFPYAFPRIGGIDVDASKNHTTWSLNMAANLEDRNTGVFWAVFLLFSWIAASIVSGSVIERIRSSALWLHAVIVGSVWWTIDAAWGWHYDGWMFKVLGYHAAYASRVIHAIAGGYAVGVLLVLGPRIGKFAADGTARDIPPHNPWLLTIGIFLIYIGFWEFYAACNVPIIAPEVIDGQITGTTWTATNIYLAPNTLSAITVNFLMSLTGGLMAAYIVSKGDLFWTFSGGLAGLITASAGNDLYHPIQAMLVASVGVVIVYRLHFWVERKSKIEDAAGAVAVHGYVGVISLIIA